MRLSFPWEYTPRPQQEQTDGPSQGTQYSANPRTLKQAEFRQGSLLRVPILFVSSRFLSTIEGGTQRG